MCVQLERWRTEGGTWLISLPWDLGERGILCCSRNQLKKYYVDDHEILYTTCAVYYIRDQKHRKCHTLAVLLTRLISSPLGFGGRRDIEMPLERSTERPLSRGGVENFLYKKTTCLKFPGYDDS